MERKIRAADLQPGMVLLRSPKREFNATVEAVKLLEPGAHVTGPRGGHYEVTSAGSDFYVSVAAGPHRPVFGKNLSVTIHVEEEF